MIHSILHLMLIVLIMDTQIFNTINTMILQIENSVFMLFLINDKNFNDKNTLLRTSLIFAVFNVGLMIQYYSKENSCIFR
jgi:hypothetical protein